MRLVCALACLLCLSPALAQDAPAPIPRGEHAREIRSLIVALGDEDWGTREAARERLIEIGHEALPYLQRAARDPDAQRASTARELLETLRWLVPADLRPALGDDFDDFPSLPVEGRLEAVGLLLQRSREAPSAAARYLVTIARFDPAAEVRQRAVYAFLEIPRGAPELDELALTALVDEADEGPLVPTLRAGLLQRLGRLDEAVTQAELARARAPQARRPLVLLAELLIELDRAGEVVEPLAAARQQAPADLELQILHGEALALSGQREAGLAELQAVLESEQAKEHEPTMIRLGRAFLRAGLHEEARGVFKEALGRFPYSRELNVGLGDLLRESGQTAEALEIYLNEIRYSQPDSASYDGLRRRLSEVLAAGGADWVADDDAFFADAQRGRKLREVRLEVGRWLRRRGLFAEAAREFALVAALSPGQAAPRILLGDALRDGGDPAAARAAYLQARELDPDDAVAQSRLGELAGVTQAAGPAVEEGSFAFWEARVEPAVLSGSPESVSDDAPPPLVLDDRVVAVAGGCAALYGFDAADGRHRWTYEPEPPPPGDGALPEQIGLELVALLRVPAAVVAATNPSRARSRRPLVAALANVYWRPANRSWRKARFLGLRAYLVDDVDGEHVGVLELDDPAQLMLPPAPVVRRGRALAFSSQGRRLNLESIDLILQRPVWRAQVPRQRMRRPVLAGEVALVAWAKGVVALDPAGELLWRHDRTLDPSQAEDDEAEPPGSVSSGLAVSGQRALFGTTEGRVIALALADGAAVEVVRPSEERVTSLVAHGGRLFVASRGGAVTGIDLGEAPSTLWRNAGPRAASRELAWAGDVLFGINGSADVFADEEPSLQALDPGSGEVLFQRPIERPAVLATGDQLVAVAAGGRGARGGLRVLGARPRERVDAATARMLELESAARDALTEGQLEVSSVLAREYMRRRGADQLGREELAFVATTLARSRRPDEALILIDTAAAAGTRDDVAFWDDLLLELGLEEPEPDLVPKDPADEPAQPEPPLDDSDPPMDHAEDDGQDDE